MRTVILGAAALVLAAGQADAQDGPTGFAAAQAAEAGTGVCFGDDMLESMQCAVDACVAESGLEPEYCGVQTYCSSAGWSADLAMLSEAGPHWHEYLCGWSTEPQLHAAIEVACSGEGLIECSAVSIWNPWGELQLPSN